jgi:chorismate mutase
MQIAENIGKYKKRNNIAILQSKRWNEILEKAIVKGATRNLSKEFIGVILKAIHQESINHQAKVMNQKEIEALMKEG